MALQPNLVVGAAGAVLALITGGIIVTDWRDLTELRDWEATFRSDDISLPTRTGDVAPGSSAKRTETHNLTRENITTLRAELTWTDPSFPATAPEVAFRVIGPDNRVRAAATHRGGSLGIEVDVEIVPVDEVPAGTHRFAARDNPHETFYQRWPAHPEGRGLWTFEITNMGSGATADSISYTLRVDFDHYTGSLREIVREAAK